MRQIFSFEPVFIEREVKDGVQFEIVFEFNYREEMTPIDADDIRNAAWVFARKECGYGYHNPKGTPIEEIEKYYRLGMKEGIKRMKKYGRRE